MRTGIRRRGAVATLAALAVLGAAAPATPVAAIAAPVSIWVQTLDSCRQTIGGAGLGLTASGVSTVRTVPTGTSRSVGAPGGGCPAERGDCSGAAPAGCAVFSITPPTAGTRTYRLEQLTVPAGYVGCTGGSACLGEVAGLTLDSTGAVLGATVTNNLPDGVVTTAPASGASFRATADDPIVLHDDAIGPGVCDGDGDSDDQLSAPAGPHCDDHSDGSLAHLTVAGAALADGGPVAAAGFQPLTSAGAPAGRRLVASPAVIAGTALDPALEIGTFDDGGLYVRSDALGWRPLWSAAPGFTCVDNPAAHLDHASATLWVACQGADHVLRYATGDLPASSFQLPTLDRWRTLPGLRLAAGPALAPAGAGAGDDPTFFAVDAAGALWSATSSSPWVSRGGTCQGHPAAALGNTGGTPATVVACRAPDGSLLYGVVGSDGGVGLIQATATTPRSGGACLLNGPLIDGPGIAATAAGVLVLVTGAADHLAYAKSISFSGAPGSGPVAISPYQALSFESGPLPGTCAAPSAANPATPLASGPAAATWFGAALTVGTVTPTILAAPHSSSTAVAHLVDAAGNPVSGQTVTFSTSALATAAATHPSGGGVYTATVTTGTSPGPARIGAATSAAQGAMAMRLYRGGYVLDGSGGVHPFGGAPALVASAYWPGWTIARGIELRPDGAGGYVLDGFGGLHPFGDAPPVQTSAYWPSWDIARGVALRTDGVSGYVLDGFGGVHSFGGAPEVHTSAYWPDWDVARGIALRSDGGGYVLDAFGGLHPFGDAPPVTGSAYWPGWDIARALAVRPEGGGYVLDGYGGIHPFGGAPELHSSAGWPGFDIARGLCLGTGGSGAVLDGYGGLATLGSGPPLSTGAYWPGSDIARGVTGG
ncbi:MAG TPA: Ig-like domain-containing protein [Candidatus Dormibacteraeota bacterium]